MIFVWGRIARREFSHMKGSSGVGRPNEQLTLAKIQELI